MSSAIERIVEQAYRTIDKASEYKIPKLEKWKKENNVGIKKVSACKSCGKLILHKTDKKPERCVNCRKKISDLYKKRIKKVSTK